MVTNIPAADDFYTAGKELLDFAWDTSCQLLTNLRDAKYYGLDIDEVSAEYWDAAKRRLRTSLSITQQGVELILKGKIAAISPFILISDTPARWPSPYISSDIDFSQFRTIDAQDLIRVHDTFAKVPLSSQFVELYNSLREKRNSILHTVNKSINVPVKEVFDSLLFMHRSLFPNETWGQVRVECLERYCEIQLGSIDYVKNNVCSELSLVFELLEPARVKHYFGVNKNQRLYYCPKCYTEADHHAGDFDYKLASLNPRGVSTTKLYCPVCNTDHNVIRKKCVSSKCPGNVISSEENICLTCGSDQQT